MASVKLSPVFNSQIVKQNGAPAVGWKINTYAANSSAKLDTYTDSTGSTPQSNPIIIDLYGFPQGGQIWLTAGASYKLVLTDENDVVIKPEDFITGVNDTGVTTDEWVDTGVAPTYISPNSYSLLGDQTAQFHINRRQKFLTTAGTVYGRITNSVFTTLTTVTVQMDGAQVLDSGLSVVQNSLLRANVQSVPEYIATTTGTDTYTANVGMLRSVKGKEYRLNFANPNSLVNPTLSLDGTTAKTIVTNNGGAVWPGALNGEHTLRDNGTAYVLLNPVALASFATLGRNCVVAGPNTRSAIGTGLAANLVAATPIYISFAAGLGLSGPIDLLGVIPANVTGFWGSLPASTAAIYGFYDRNPTTGAITGVTSVLPLIRQDSSVAVSVANGQHTYLSDTGVMYVGNGTTASIVQRVLGERFVTNTTNVTAVLSYDKGNKATFTATSLTSGSGNSFPHGFGTASLKITSANLINKTAEGGWVPGHEFPINPVGTFDGAAARGPSFDFSNTDVGYRISTNTWSFVNISSGVNFTVTPANWDLVFTVEPKK